MAEKQDIAMNQFQVVTDADYVYVEKGNSQGKIKSNILFQNNALFKAELTISAGEQVELPYSAGLIIVGNASHTRKRACALLTSDGEGTILVPEISINFFSEVGNKICILNSGHGTKYIVKNTNSQSMSVYITFIKS